MCCSNFWTALQILWSCVYVICGTTQLVSGIFFLVSLPTLHLTSNMVAGCLNLMVGIGGGAIVCFLKLSPRRQEMLLYMAIALLCVNLGNVIVSEWGLYFEEALARANRNRQAGGNANQHVLVVYARFLCRIAAAVAVLVSFLDTQFAFISMQLRTFEKCKEKEKKPQQKKFPHENSQDIEYIIPRQNSPKSHTFYNAYSQSWVFEADHANSSNNNGYNTKINGSPLKRAVQNKNLNQSNCNGSTSKTTEISHLIDNPVVHIEEASDESSSNRSDRNLCNMRSFSRTNSPLTLSASSSQISLHRSEKAPIYNYLEKLTEPEIYRSRLNSALSSGEPTPAVLMHRIETPSPRSENAQYSSLMQELQKAIVNKKDISPQSTSDSANSNSQEASANRRESSNNNSDVEFSKELEAALQLIQDLESPNLAETPSEGSKTLTDEKKLSTTSLNISQQDLSSFKPVTLNGLNSIQIRLPDSQSTSGYSSPTQNTPAWSTTSSINGTSNNKDMSFSIRNANSGTVISLYAPTALTTKKEKNVTLISIKGDTNSSKENIPITKKDLNNLFEQNKDDIVHYVRNSDGIKPSSTTSGWKSLLRKKRTSVPKLCPELEGAIIKSESLAYLSEIELLARHQRNHEIQREIEERVIQQLGAPRNDSRC